MRFKNNIMGFFVLGLMFVIFVTIPAAIIIQFIAIPLILGGAGTGMVWPVLMAFVVVMVLFLVIVGWLIFRFVKTNQFG